MFHHPERCWGCSFLILIKGNRLSDAQPLRAGGLIPLLVPRVDHNWEEPWGDILSTTFGAVIGGLIGIGYIAIREAYERREPEMNANQRE
jgi:hypothetical protein